MSSSSSFLRLSSKGDNVNNTNAAALLPIDNRDASNSQQLRLSEQNRSLWNGGHDDDDGFYGSSAEKRKNLDETRSSCSYNAIPPTMSELLSSHRSSTHVAAATQWNPMTKPLYVKTASELNVAYSLPAATTSAIPSDLISPISKSLQKLATLRNDTSCMDRPNASTNACPVSMRKDEQEKVPTVASHTLPLDSCKALQPSHGNVSIKRSVLFRVVSQTDTAAAAQPLSAHVPSEAHNVRTEESVRSSSTSVLSATSARSTSVLSATSARSTSVLSATSARSTSVLSATSARSPLVIRRNIMKSLGGVLSGPLQHVETAAPGASRIVIAPDAPTMPSCTSYLEADPSWSLPPATAPPAMYAIRKAKLYANTILPSAPRSTSAAACQSAFAAGSAPTQSPSDGADGILWTASRNSAGYAADLSQDGTLALVSGSIPVSMLRVNSFLSLPPQMSAYRFTFSFLGECKNGGNSCGDAFSSGNGTDSDACVSGLPSTLSVGVVACSRIQRPVVVGGLPCEVGLSTLGIMAGDMCLHGGVSIGSPSRLESTPEDDVSSRSSSDGYCSIRPFQSTARSNQRLQRGHFPGSFSISDSVEMVVSSKAEFVAFGVNDTPVCGCPPMVTEYNVCTGPTAIRTSIPPLIPGYVAASIPPGYSVRVERLNLCAVSGLVDVIRSTMESSAESTPTVDPED